MFMAAELRLSLSSTALNLDHTLSCGQVFRWVKKGEWWIGVVEGAVLKISQSEDGLTVISSSDEVCEESIRMYLRLDDDLPEIFSKIGRDRVIGEAIYASRGLRLVRQNPWECTASFICATNANISAIQSMISNICRLLGRGVEFEGRVFYTFPEPEVVAEADRFMLERYGLGYRAGFLIETAKRVTSGDVVFQDLVNLDYESAKRRLMAKPLGRKLLPGIGPKVADCILLFSLGKLEAFPVDVWIHRAVLKFYPHLFDPESLRRIASGLERSSSMTIGEYGLIAKTMRSYFGEYAGYAQEYLYHYVRNLKGLSSHLWASKGPYV